MRPGEEYVVVIEKTDFANITGLQVKQSKYVVEVHMLKSGLIKEWNRQNAGRAVKVGDQLVEVNGVRGPSSKHILQKFQREQRLELIFMRKDRGVRPSGNRQDAV